MRRTALISGRLLFVAWNFGSPLVGPLVLPSRARRQGLAALQGLAVGLESIPALGGLRLFESRFIIPVHDRPRFDVVLLLDGSDEAIETAREAIARADVATPTFVGSARNVERFGDTDALNGPILLNHFVSSRPTEEVAEVWARISTWYGDALGVDNSTLLTFDAPSPFVAVNYASIPGSVGRFMLNQLRRPSFRTNVLDPLKAVDARAMPLFARRVRRPFTDEE